MVINHITVRKQLLWVVGVGNTVRIRYRVQRRHPRSQCSSYKTSLAIGTRSTVLELLHSITYYSGVRFDPAITVLEALEENIALQNLRLEFKIDESPLSIASANTMAASIQKFGTLKELNLICDDRRDEEKFDIVAAVLQGLAENTSLTVAKFRQRRPISCDKARESLIQICCHTEIEKLGLSLEGNTDFKNLALWVGDQSISLGAKIEFWLKVNQSGARELGSQPCNRKLWVDMLIENKESPMLSFYVFLSNPHLFFQQAEKGPEKRADLQPKSHKLRKLSHP